MQSETLTQLDLAISHAAKPVNIDPSLIQRQPNLLAAINLCITASGLEDKQIYLSLGIDPGHWTRIRRGDAHFPTNEIGRLMDLCGNETPLIWLAFNRGMELKPLLGDLERQNAELRKRLAERDRDIQTIQKFMAGAR